jgi:hypothetical protein
MSEENVPKLRLKPKLAADPSTAQPTAATPAEPAAAPEQPAAEAPKLIRLKPKLGVAPTEEATSTPVTEPASTPATTGETPAVEPTTNSEAAPAPETPPLSPEPVAKPAFKLGLKPKAAAPEPAGEPPPLTESVPPPMLDAPPPPPQGEADQDDHGEPDEAIAMRKVTSAPFPVPGKFPPPPGLKKALAAASEEVTKKKQATPGSKKKVLLLGGGLVALLILGAGGFFAYQKFTEPPPPPPKLVANPVTPQGQAIAKAKTVAEQAKEQAAAPVNEILGDDPKPAEIKPTEPVAVTPEPAPKPPEEVKPAIPQPSIAFRGWVENLKISGVRGGANPRIFVGGSSYQPGDLVNPQLGITFVGYNDATRMLTFTDKSGAKVERRN